MQRPYLEINLSRIEHNAKVVKELCDRYGIELFAVLKGCSAMPEVAFTVVKTGVAGLADSRLANLRRLREAGIRARLMLLRISMLSELDELLQLADVSLQSELEVIVALEEKAGRLGRTHDICLMVDVGDLREGVLPDDVPRFVGELLPHLKNVRLTGLGTNLGCYGGVLPTRENTGLLVTLRDELEQRFNIKLPVISGGNTASTVLLEDENIPEGVTQFRVGEGILLGTDVTGSRVLCGTKRDTFILKAEIVELKTKPSVPFGETGRDAFGGKPEFEDRGDRLRAILAVGRQDFGDGELTPQDEGAVVLGASSDHLILDVTDVKRQLSIGSELSFNLSYSAILHLSTSPYVDKVFLRE